MLTALDHVIIGVNNLELVLHEFTPEMPPSFPLLPGGTML